MSDERVERSRKPLPEMMGANKAVRELAPIVGSHAAARAEILDQLKYGSLKTFALHQWSVKRGTVDDIWQSGAPANATRKKRVRKALFSGARWLDEDERGWDWKRGNLFVTTRKAGPSRTRTFLEQVQFAKSDVEALATRLRNKRTTGGRPTETEAWQAFWLEVLSIAVRGELNFVRYPTHKKLKSDIFIALGWDKLEHDKQPLKLGTLTQAIGVIWNRFIEPTKPTSDDPRP